MKRSSLDDKAGVPNMNNVEFSYLYRDGGNYKKFGRVVFSNPEQITWELIVKALTEAFLEQGLFIADQVRLPEVFLFANAELSFDDHCYHEFDAVRPSEKESTDPYMRTISEFVSEVIQQGERGWRVFDPYDSEGSYGYLLASRGV
jgi:hypothetical protein